MGIVTNNLYFEATNLTKNMTQNFDLGSKLCPIVSECRDFTEGIKFGDHKMAIYSGALIGAYAL